MTPNQINGNPMDQYHYDNVHEFIPLSEVIDEMDEVLQSVTLKEAQADNDPYEGAKAGDKYFEFTFRGNDNIIYAPLGNTEVANYVFGEGLIEKDGTVVVDKSFVALKSELCQLSENVAYSIETLNKNVADGFNTINGGIDNEIRPAITEAKEVADKALTAAEKAQADVATVNENLVTAVENINKNVADGFNTINGGIDNEIRPAVSANTEALKTKVDWTDVATPENPGRKSIILKNHDIILGTKTDGSTVALAMLSKWDKADFGSAQVELNLNGSAAHPTYNDEKELAFVEEVETVKATAEAAATKAAEVDAVKTTADAAMAKANEVDTVKSNLEATNAEVAAVKATAEGAAAKAAEIDGVKADVETVKTDVEALKTSKVDLVDVATEENPGRKAILLRNHDVILGQSTSGDAYNIAMVSKWDKVDLGSASLEMNLNGKAEHPTYNDEKELAFVDEVEAVKATAEGAATKAAEIDTVKADVDTLKTELEEAKPTVLNTMPVLTGMGEEDNYTEQEILGWFGAEDIYDVKHKAIDPKGMFINFGLSLSGMPYRYKVPVMYMEFASNTSFYLIGFGPDHKDADKLKRYRIDFTLNGDQSKAVLTKVEEFVPADKFAELEARVVALESKVQ